MRFLYLLLSILLVVNSSYQKADNLDPLSYGEHFIVVNGVSLCYHVSGKGPLLLFYPASAGWGGDISIHRETLKPLEKIRKIIYLEPRGIGKSQRLENTEHYSMDNYVTELEAFRETLNVDSWDLAGFCYGGFIALKYAIKYPDRISNLLLFNTTPNLAIGDYPSWAKKRDGFVSMVAKFDSIGKLNISDDERLGAYMKAWLPITMNNYGSLSSKVDRLTSSITFSSKPQSYFENTDKNKYNVCDSIYLITSRTLLLTSDDDFPPMKIGSNLMYEKIQNSELVVLENCAHWPMIEQPKLFFKAIETFLRKENI